MKTTQPPEFIRVAEAESRYGLPRHAVVRIYQEYPQVVLRVGSAVHIKVREFEQLLNSTRQFAGGAVRRRKGARG